MVTITGKNPGNDLQYVTITDVNGFSPPVVLPAMDRKLTLRPAENIPVTTYDVLVVAPGYFRVRNRNVPVYGGTSAIQPVELIPLPEMVDGVRNRPSMAPRHRIYDTKGGLLVTGEPYIPETITVHLGTPDSSAQNVTVSFPDYIKNVASSEIYPTWPENAIRANVYAQISYALNRVYTEWYRSRGYDFDITNSTRYDQAFVQNRDIYDNVSDIVDEIFNNYVRRQGSVEPYFTQYCNGTTVTCDGLSQWGTVPLAEQGYTPLSDPDQLLWGRHRDRHQRAGEDQRPLLSRGAAAHRRRRQRRAQQADSAQPHLQQLPGHSQNLSSGRGVRSGRRRTR